MFLLQSGSDIKEVVPDFTQTLIELALSGFESLQSWRLVFQQAFLQNAYFWKFFFCETAKTLQKEPSSIPILKYMDLLRFSMLHTAEKLFLGGVWLNYWNIPMAKHWLIYAEITLHNKTLRKLLRNTKMLWRLPADAENQAQQSLLKWKPFYYYFISYQKYPLTPLWLSLPWYNNTFGYFAAILSPPKPQRRNDGRLYRKSGKA